MNTEDNRKKAILDDLRKDYEEYEIVKTPYSPVTRFDPKTARADKNIETLDINTIQDKTRKTFTPTNISQPSSSNRRLPSIDDDFDSPSAQAEF